MSDASYPPPPPPYDPTPGFGPPPGGAELPRLPWEERGRLGWSTALVDTAKLLATAPDDAFRRLRADGDLASPLLFGVLFSWAGMIVSMLWNFLFQGAMLGMMGGGDLPIEGAVAPLVVYGGVTVAWPLLFLVFIFIGAAIWHLPLMIVGATAESRTGFEGTLKVLCYAMVANVANLVPFVGGLIYTVGWLVLLVIGFKEVHRTTTGRSIAAVASIFLLCCLCVVVIAVAFGAAIAAALANLGH